MNIFNVNLLELSRKLEAGNLTDAELSLVNKIMWDVINDLPEKMDIIMVPGFPECVEKRLPKALQLYNRYREPYILLCGGVKIPGLALTEAEAMGQACRAAGIPDEKILLENKSSTTKENVEFSSSIVHGIFDHDIVIGVVSSATHLRRVRMNFHRYVNQFPGGMEVIAIASDAVSYGEWMNVPELREQIATELRFIHEYIYELGYEGFEI